MAEARRLYIGNSLFRKREMKRWTWISPNSKHRSEIDYILVDKRRILHDVSVVSPFNTGSDHRLVRARVVIDGKREKMALYLASGGGRVRVYNEANLQEAIMQEDWCQGDGIDDDYNPLIGKLKECLRKAKGVCLREKKGSISEETTKLLEKRKNMKRTIEDHLEYSILSRVIRQQDFEAYRMEKLLNASEEKKRDMVLYRSDVTALKNTDGIPVNEKSEMEKVCEDFYTKLFKSTRNVQPLPPLQQEENVPPILVSEVERAIGSMKNGKVPGKDGITSEVLKSGREQLWKILAERITHYLDEGRILSQWKESNTILLYKKGDREDLKELPTHMPAVSRVQAVHEDNSGQVITSSRRKQSREQAGFRKNYSTMDHIVTLTQLLERANEYKLPLCVAFVNYEKAFDSVETNALLNSLQSVNNFTPETIIMYTMRKSGCVSHYINHLMAAVLSQSYSYGFRFGRSSYSSQFSSGEILLVSLNFHLLYNFRCR
ncbi:uncharacterized protein LOC115219685 [Octopus sinensis]|uniref:Uncharacterized protein LOC115219685 n=1 Tax=Octopus sinensis TaxID=2607531 RepID=A0A7E6FCW2_9MOLL|nr:uncharacterized protein LOC115219685 [Octopus sinensis]